MTDEGKELVIKMIKEHSQNLTDLDKANLSTIRRVLKKHKNKSKYIDYSKEKFNVGDKVSFNVTGTEIIGNGFVGGKASNGLAPTWSIIINRRDTEFMKNTPELVLIIQENFLKKVIKNV